jgi:hypothetical protein
MATQVLAGPDIASASRRSVGVFFDSAEGCWGLYGRRGQTLPTGATSHVQWIRRDLIPRRPAFLAAFTHRATAANIEGQSTFINSLRYLNGRPEAILHVIPNTGTDRSGVDAGGEIGIWYDGARGQWAIFHQDLSPMVEGAVFNVIVMRPGEDRIVTPNINFLRTASFVHRTNVLNTRSVAASYLDHPSTNNRPRAAIVVTPNWTQVPVYNPHPIGVWYSRRWAKWAILNLDGAPAPVDTAFNVTVHAEPEPLR